MKLQFLANTRSRRRSRRSPNEPSRANTRRERSRRTRDANGSREAARSKSASDLPTLYQLLWALIGLLLTIGGTLVEAFATNLPWHWLGQGIQAHSLGVTCQIGAVLLVGCLGGKKAGALSQIAYVLLGLTGVFPVFTQGGGLSYLLEPTFGYILGFIPGAWLCGLLAFRYKVNLESLALSCAIGLLAIHWVGITYLTGLHLLSHAGSDPTLLVQGIMKYSVDPLSSQLAIVCAVSLLGYILRRILFY